MGFNGFIFIFESIKTKDQMNSHVMERETDDMSKQLPLINSQSQSTEVYTLEDVSLVCVESFFVPDIINAGVGSSHFDSFATPTIAERLKTLLFILQSQCITRVCPALTVQSTETTTETSLRYWGDDTSICPDSHLA